tara:strand:- start:119 stop:541 length:423 start_codon:yes stop_codon:yes gene_type:complete
MFLDKSLLITMKNNDIIKILTYWDDLSQVIINYSMLIIVILYLLFDKYNKISDIYIVIGLFVFQILLCLLVNCEGISVIWNALTSYIFMRHLRNNSFTIKKDILFIIIPAFFVNLYYINDLNATIAHIISIILGIIIEIY